MQGRIIHPPAAAAGTEPAAFARECHDLTVSTVAAHNQNTTVIQDPATQILFDLANHELRQATLLVGSLAKLREVRAQRLVQHRVLRGATPIPGWTRTRCVQCVRHGPACARPMPQPWLLKSRVCLGALRRAAMFPPAAAS